MQIKAILMAAAIMTGAGVGCASAPVATQEAGEATQVAEGRGVCAGPRQRMTGSRIATQCQMGQVGSAEGLRSTPVGVGTQAEQDPTNP